MIPSHCQDVFWGGKEFTEFSWHQEWKSSPWENRESAWVSGCFCQMCSGVRVPSASSGTGWGFGYPVSVATDHNLWGFTAEGMPYFFHKENQFFSSTESSIGVWLRNVSYSEPGQLCLCARARVHVCLCCGKIIHNRLFHFNSFSVYSSVALDTFTIPCNHYHTFSSSQIDTLNPLNIDSLVFPFPRPWQPAFSFLSIWIWLFQILHRSGIIQYLSFCGWPVSCF